MPNQSNDAKDHGNAGSSSRGYRVTGRAAHGRVARLFQTLLHEETADDGHTTQEHSRCRWIDTSPYASTTTSTTNNDELEIAFLWENAPRFETKSIRDSVQVYSHLPNGIQVLDDKWALARLTHNCSGDNNNEALATLESHCFRGSEGFSIFAQRVGLLSADEDEAYVNSEAQYQFEDLRQTTQQSQLLSPPPPPKNLWVIKDAMSNGAGGIWIVDPFNAHEFIHDNNKDQQQTMILHPQHRYIAQQYAWPPTLYNSRKCHVRVYGLITSDGCAYIHKRAFLHVANEIFESSSSNNDDEATNEGNEYNTRRGRFEPSVHITNCCANSHDEIKFSGEICVELDKPGPFSISCSNDSSNSGSSGDGDLPLGDYFPSIAASVAMLAEKSAPYVQGGQANNGFEYLGLDFVLSSVPDETDEDSTRLKPVAYLLEVNAPPSQDTATGLPHAEELHDEVISDLLRLWVLPHLGIQSSKSENGWKRVYSPPSSLDKGPAVDIEESSNLIVPSKAAILNKIRWAMFEKRASKQYESSWRNEGPDGEDNDSNSHKCESEENEGSDFDATSIVSFVRSQFPYFIDSTTTLLSSAETPAGPESIFLESGGGSQVPRIVLDSMSASLMNRDRCVVGAEYLREARKSIASLLVESRRSDEEVQDGDEEQAVIMGANATSLIDILARMYVANGILRRDDEVVIASENHLANVTPWIKAAESVGATVKWWTVTKCDGQQRNGKMYSSSNVLSDLVNERTKIVAVSHASNVLGCVRDISAICNLVRKVTRNEGHVVVDGVAAAPHLLSWSGMWYVVSLHKLFGPHLGCLIGERSTALQVANLEEHSSNEKICKAFEIGTVNYEACAGAIALKEYFNDLGINAWRRSGGGYEGVHCHSQMQKPQLTATQASGDQVVERSSSLSNSSAHLSIARSCIVQVETRLLNSILGYLRMIRRVRIIEDVGDMKVSIDGGCIPNGTKEQRIPIVSFVHEGIPSSQIVEHCRNHGVICRACKFLATNKLWDEMKLTEYDGVVRFSFAHYNKISDVKRTINVLEMLQKWW